MYECTHTYIYIYMLDIMLLCWIPFLNACCSTWCFSFFSFSCFLSLRHTNKHFLYVLLVQTPAQQKPDTLAASSPKRRTTKGVQKYRQTHDAMLSKNNNVHTSRLQASMVGLCACVCVFGLVPTSKSMFIRHHSPCETMWNGMHSDFGCALPSPLSSSQIIILFPCYTTLTHIYSKKSTQHREYKNNKQLFIFVLYGCHYNYYHPCSLSIIFVSFMNFQLTSSSHLAPLTKWYFNEEIYSFHI